MLKEGPDFHTQPSLYSQEEIIKELSFRYKGKIVGFDYEQDEGVSTYAFMTRSEGLWHVSVGPDVGRTVGLDVCSPSFEPKRFCNIAEVKQHHSTVLEHVDGHSRNILFCYVNWRELLPCLGDFPHVRFADPVCYYEVGLGKDIGDADLVGMSNTGRLLVFEFGTKNSIMYDGTNRKRPQAQKYRARLQRLAGLPTPVDAFTVRYQKKNTQNFLNFQRV